MRLTSVLLMQHFDMKVWWKTLKPGILIDDIGAPMLHLWEWTLTYRVLATPSKHEHLLDSQLELDLAIIAEASSTIFNSQ